MQLGLDRREFLEHLLQYVHVEDPRSGLCVICRPVVFHPCRVWRRVSDELAGERRR